ncbi:MAG: FtsW/RodA/SpoVE family cell cycle protein [Clostridia bacterium]|nr:FtsW/RodA/SpoVE family cell cycle protein [Clostridia bacterium]
METTKNKKLYFGRPGSMYGLISLLIMLFLTIYQVIMSYCVLSQDSDNFSELLLYFSAYIIAEWIYYFIFAIVQNRHISLEIIAFALSSISLFVTASVSPGKTQTQFVAIFIGLALYIAMVQYMKSTTRTGAIRIPMAVAAIGLLAFTLVFASYTNGAKNWIYIGPISIQPSEFVKLAFIYVGAATLDKIQSTKSLTAYVFFSVGCVGLLGLMSDFGTALIYFATFILIAFLRSGDIRTIVLVCTAAVIGAILILTLKSYILNRFASYRHIWEHMYDSGGYQQTRTLIYSASGGFFGVGIGNGHLRDIFAATEDLIFGLVCEELGMLTGFLIVITLILLAFAASYNAKFSRSSFFTIAACAAAGMIIVQTSLNVFGVTDFLPLTGVTLPFVSRGGSSMICSWGLLAFIKAADSRSYPQLSGHVKRNRR